MKKRSHEFFGGEVNKTTEKQLADQIALSTAGDESIDDLANRIRKTYKGIKEGRVENIARTESLNAINEAQLGVYNDDETIESLQWVATLDNRTRDDHLALHGKIIVRPSKRSG